MEWLMDLGEVLLANLVLGDRTFAHRTALRSSASTFASMRRSEASTS